MVLALCSVLNTFFDFFGIETCILSLIGGMSVLPLLFLYLSSFAFRFCRYHRMFLHYILVNDILTWFDYTIGIPVDTLALFCIHMMLICVFLFLILYFHQKEKCCRQ